jgi:hypothetical protein
MIKLKVWDVSSKYPEIARVLVLTIVPDTTSVSALNVRVPLTPPAYICHGPRLGRGMPHSLQLRAARRARADMFNDMDPIKPNLQPFSEFFYHLFGKFSVQHVADRRSFFRRSSAASRPMWVHETNSDPSSTVRFPKRLRVVAGIRHESAAWHYIFGFGGGQVAQRRGSTQRRARPRHCGGSPMPLQIGRSLKRTPSSNPFFKLVIMRT